MKNRIQTFILSTLVILAFGFTALAQSSNADTITKINGETISVKILNTTDKEITYSHPGETMTITISKNIIREIIYASGRKETVNEPVIISGEADWEKVILTTLASDVDGLVKKGELDARRPNLGLYTPAKKTNEKLEKEIRTEAAKIGAHIVLLSTPHGSPTEYRITGTAYGYK